MALPIKAIGPTGKTLFATIERMSDGYFWNPTAVAFQSAPAFNDKKITLTEGSGDEAGKYVASVGSLGSPGRVMVYVCNSGGTKTLGQVETYVISDNEYDYQAAIATTGTTANSTYNIVNHATYGNAAIQTQISAIAPLPNVADGFTPTYGSVISGDYTDTATDDNTRHVLAPEAVNGLDIEYTFNIGSFKSSYLSWQGFYNSASGQFTHAYAWNYISASWDQLSNTSNRINHGTTDVKKGWPLAAQNTDSNGDVIIRFVSSSTNTGYRFSTDDLKVYSISDAGSTAGSPARLAPDGLDAVLMPNGTTKWKEATGSAAAALLGTTTNADTTSETFSYAGLTIVHANDGTNRTTVTVTGW